MSAKRARKRWSVAGDTLSDASAISLLALWILGCEGVGQHPRTVTAEPLAV
jgi:hypothetical protein